MWLWLVWLGLSLQIFFSKKFLDGKPTAMTNFKTIHSFIICISLLLGYEKKSKVIQGFTISKGRLTLVHSTRLSSDEMYFIVCSDDLQKKPSIFFTQCNWKAKSYCDMYQCHFAFLIDLLFDHFSVWNNLFVHNVVW